MTDASAAGWVGAAVILSGYAWSVALHKPTVFHVANLVGVWGVAWSAIAAHAWPNLFITVAFAAIALAGLMRVHYD